MKSYSVQMIDGSVSSKWWKQIIMHFMKENDRIEIRCWREETDEIAHAKRYGEATEAGYEISITATVTEELISELMSYAICAVLTMERRCIY